MYEILDYVLPRNPSAAAPTRGIRPVTSPGRCNGVTAPTTAAVGPPSPAKLAPVLASRANPPERRREESGNYSEIFRNKIINLVNNCHTASPPTTGKLTEIKIIDISL